MVAAFKLKSFGAKEGKQLFENSQKNKPVANNGPKAGMKTTVSIAVVWSARKLQIP